MGAIGEVVGATGVILTLVYLTTQIRQNTRQLRSQGHQGITDSYNAILGQLLADDSLFKTAEERKAQVAHVWTIRYGRTVKFQQ